MTNDLAIYDRVQDPLVYAERMGVAMAKSGMFGLANDQAGVVIAMTCLCERITPLEFQRTYHIVQGRPSMRADAMLAEFRKRGGKHKVLQRDPSGASVELTAADGTHGTFSLSWEEAQREDFTQGKEGNIKDNYAYPRKRMQMLWARVISDGVRTLTPEIVAGIYTPEEVADFDLPVVEKPKPTVEEAAKQLQEQHIQQPPFRSDSPASNGELANDIQIARLEGLVKQLDMPQEKLTAALSKRGVSSLEDLNPGQADELIEKLQGMASQLKN